jgi:putative ABC transport system permease protein
MVAVKQNMLQKKIFRDIQENRWAFFAIVCVCTLGIALYSGMNLYVSTVENELNTYYDRGNLADYWVYKAVVSSADVEALRSLPDIAEAQRRKAADLALTGGLNAIIHIHAVDEPAAINIPELLEGAMLDEGETNALLLDSRFAEIYQLSAGDTISTGQSENKRNWLIKGIVRNVEYVYYAPEGLTMPNYHKYGFAYTAANELPDVPFNEIVLTVQKKFPPMQEYIMSEIRNALGPVNILSRQHEASYRKTSDSLTGVRQIGLLFSIAFFITAALITWITVSRIMENQRQHLGTLRSIGFSNREIIGRYASFGILISLPSMVLAWFISRFIIAASLYNVGIAYYTIEKTGVYLFSPHFFIAAVCVTMITCGATVISCRKSLQFTPAALMRPKPPAQGHRILLERIPLFWKRLSFSGKMVTRNLFRNKARLLMGLVGITGSASLILCGFGLMNSINAMLDKAFDETIRYNVEIKLRSPLPIEQIADIYETLETARHIDAAMAFGVYLYGKNGETQNPYLVIMDREQQSFNFKDANGNPVALPDSGAVITPRMAAALDTESGWTLTAERLDGTAIPLTVAHIADFPVGNEIYMSKDAFSKISDLPFLVRTLLISGEGIDTSKLEQDSRISLIETKEEMRANMRIILQSLQGFQIILIVFSGLLAFAVMLVLGRMNFYERIRELATLKVLGFFKTEMKRLVLRENIWITLFGLPAGLLFGSLLLRLILTQATTPDLEIAPFISLFSIFAGFVFMLVFTLLVNSVMSNKFKTIDMVSSLKSVE